MTQYIATFHTHFSAMSTHRAMRRHGIDARLAPVPRSLSSSCGTCVRYCADGPHAELVHEDFEQIAQVLDTALYQIIASNE